MEMGVPDMYAGQSTNKKKIGLRIKMDCKYMYK